VREPTTPEELWEWCDSRLPAFAVPRYLRFVEALPKTPSEKVQKAVLREQGGTTDTHDREKYRQQQKSATRDRSSASRPVRLPRVRRPGSLSGCRTRRRGHRRGPGPHKEEGPSLGWWDGPSRVRRGRRSPARQGQPYGCGEPISGRRAAPRS